jgi:hypothetical protein
MVVTDFEAISAPNRLSIAYFWFKPPLLLFEFRPINSYTIAGMMLNREIKNPGSSQLSSPIK